MIKSCFIIENKVGKKRVLPFYSRLTIGRASRNDIALPDRTASKRHAIVGRVKGRAIVKDLDSRNGTFVNGEKVEKAVLLSGDRLKIGNVTLRYFQEDDVPESKLGESAATSQCHKKLGEYLLEAGIVDEYTLLRALDEEEKCRTIDQILIDSGVLDDESIASALARQLKVPLIHLNELEIPEQVLAMVPVEVAKTHLLIPVKITAGKLLVAMANPLDSDAMRVLRMVTRTSIEIAVSPKGDILEALSRCYAVEFLNQILAGDPSLDDVTIDI
jgi:hypothetical protein